MNFNPCCCCDIMMIVVSNSNSEIDDDFQIKLNGFTLGGIDNNANACTGRIYLMKVGNSLWPEAGDPVPACGNITNVANNYFCDSGVCSFSGTLTFSISFLNQGSNTLEIRVLAVHDNGNFGKVKVLGLQQVGSNFEVCRVYLESTYNFFSPSEGDVLAALPDGLLKASYTFDWSL